MDYFGYHGNKGSPYHAVLNILYKEEISYHCHKSIDGSLFAFKVIAFG